MTKASKVKIKDVWTQRENKLGGPHVHIRHASSENRFFPPFTQIIWFPEGFLTYITNRQTNAVHVHRCDDKYTDYWKTTCAGLRRSLWGVTTLEQNVTWIHFSAFSVRPFSHRRPHTESLVCFSPGDSLSAADLSALHSALSVCDHPSWTAMEGYYSEAINTASWWLN